MAGSRAPKKTETIEIRLSHEAKTEFMERCRVRGVSASEAIRAMMVDHAKPCTPAATSTVRWRTIAAAVAGMALGAGAAAPALAHASQPSRAAFAALDRNHDGELSYTEFSAR